MRIKKTGKRGVHMYIRSIVLCEEAFSGDDAYLNGIPAVRALDAPLSFAAPVTFLVGENGSGKSTLLEAIAVASGFNPEGGTKNFNFSSRDTHSGLHRHLRIARSPKRPRDGFFLRAESFYNVASNIDVLDEGVGDFIAGYGGRSLHRQSHGESVLSLVLNRLNGYGLYLFDEPEAALSPSRQLTLLAAIHRLVKNDSQLIIATHSPILMAYPNAVIYLLDEEGVRPIPYEETEHYQVMHSFMAHPKRMLDVLLDE